MAVLISTNMYRAGELKRILPYLKEFKGRIGAEVFPMFHAPVFEVELKECLFELKHVPVSFHGPYYGAEHSAPEGTAEYEKTMLMFDKTVCYGDLLRSRYIVYHHNNCKATLEKKQERLQVSCENFRRAEKLSARRDIPLVVENAGVVDRGNMLLDQSEFVDICKKEKYRVLIDIGHANANGWNLRGVMESLQDQIIAYHLHNNDGQHDSHQRIHNGTLDFERFVSDCRALTPQADWVLEYGQDVAEDEEGICEDIEYLLRLCSL